MLRIPVESDKGRQQVLRVELWEGLAEEINVVVDRRSQMAKESRTTLLGGGAGEIVFEGFRYDQSWAFLCLYS